MSEPTSQSPATPIEVPTIPAPVAQPIVEIEVPSAIQPATEKVSVKKALGINIQGPKELLGEDPEEKIEELDRMSGKPARERDATGKFVPKGTGTAPKEPVVPAKAEPKAKTPPEPPKPATPAPTQKIKVGDEELTPEEITARMKELREKVEAAAKPPVAKEPEVPAQTPEQIQQARAKEEETCLAELESDYMIPQAEFDTALLEGNAKVFARMFAKAEMRARQWFTSKANPEFDKIYKNMEPVIKMQGEVQKFQTESQFLNANPDIKAHPKGMETQRAIDQEMRETHEDLRLLAEAGRATPRHLEKLKIFDDATPEQWSASVAQHTRSRLGITATPPAAPAPVTEPPRAKPPTEQPFNEGANRPGGARGGGPAKNEEQRLVDAVMSR